MKKGTAVLSSPDVVYTTPPGSYLKSPDSLKAGELL